MAASGNGEDVALNCGWRRCRPTVRIVGVGTRAEPVVSYRGYGRGLMTTDGGLSREQTGEKSQFGASCVCYKLLRFEAALTATNINIVGCPHHPRQLNSQLLLVRGIALFFSSCQRSVRHTNIHTRIHRGRRSLPSIRRSFYNIIVAVATT